MDDPLRANFASASTLVFVVLILVVMDDPLRVAVKKYINYKHETSLNPCCNG